MRLATNKEGQLRRWFSIPKIAEALGVHEDTILRMIHRKELTAVRWKSRLLRVPEDELERIMQRQREGREFKPETVSEFIPKSDEERPRGRKPHH
jgi:excisionase family DNA binding protein